MYLLRCYQQLLAFWCVLHPAGQSSAALRTAGRGACCPSFVECFSAQGSFDRGIPDTGSPVPAKGKLLETLSKLICDGDHVFHCLTEDKSH